LTIAGHTFTVDQEAFSTSFSVSSIAPNSGSSAGGSEVTISGSGFQTGAAVSIGGSYAKLLSLTSSQIVAATGIAAAPGTFDVVVTNPGGTSVVLRNGFTYEASADLGPKEVFVPIVLSSGGLSGSLYTSEMTLTNRGPRDLVINYSYTAALGSGSGMATESIGPGKQKILPDTIQYLRSLGIPIPATGNQGGSLRVIFSGLASPSDAGVTVRTTTVVPEGRAGLSYPGIPATLALTEPSYICGLRQNHSDRSNVALQNAGSASAGTISLRLTVFSGYEGPSYVHVLPDLALPAGGFAQISEILNSAGWAFETGYVRVERISGTAPYYAYGVINDQINSDGSFIAPIPESALAGKTRMTLPVVVEAGAYTTELVVTNWSSSAKTLNCKYVSENIQTSDASASFTLTVNPGQQRIIPNLVQWLRDSQITGIGAAGPTLAGALFVSVSSGDLNGISVAARTSNPGGGGQYGLFYLAVPEGTASLNEAWIYGLQQNAESRTNLALVNTGGIDANPGTFQIELFDGSSGAKVNTIDNISLNANRWVQINSILANYAPSATQGYARIIRTAGANPFIVYAVINDGSQPSQRSGDGSFVTSVP
jgi:hypothetical protein